VAHDPNPLRSLVNASGFVFQLAVEDSVRGTAVKHGWRVDAREYPWSTGRFAGFADVILRKGPCYLVLECKRQRDSDWVFLLPDAEQSDRTHAKVRWTNTVPHQRPLSDYGDLQIYPASPEVDFCVVRGQSDKDRPLLERVAAEIVEAVEGISANLLRINERSGTTHVIIPVIVTTAKLHLCRFDPADIDLATGELPAADFGQVDSVRFRKSFSPGTVPDDREPQELQDLSVGSERTVFVVSAPALPDWLGKFEVLHRDGFMPWEAARAREAAGG
jgi:hypothetical protein